MKASWISGLFLLFSVSLSLGEARSALASQLPSHHSRHHFGHSRRHSPTSSFLFSSVNVTADFSSSRSVSPLLWGAFFEEINHAGEGGIYAEMVQDRSFDDFLRSNVSLYNSLMNGDTYLRHCDYVSYASPVSTQADKQDSSFLFASSLNGATNGVSLESYNFPGFYLRVHSDGSLRLSVFNSTDPNFNDDASFALDKFDAKNVAVRSLSTGPFADWFVSKTEPATGSCSFAAPAGDIVLQNQTRDGSIWTISPPNALNTPAWQTEGDATISISRAHPLNNKNLNSLFLQTTSASAGVKNTGFWGMNLVHGSSYVLSFWARTTDPQLILQLSLISSTGDSYGSAKVSGFSSAWTRFEAIIKVSIPSATNNPNGALLITLPAPSSVYLDVVSLFPQENIQVGHPFRLDLLDMLRVLKPAFLRFPGGCYVEGNVLNTSFRWEPSVGPIEARPGHMNDVWGYWSTDGLGFLEYLQLTELLGTEPVWVINNGVSHQQSVATRDIQGRVQEALNSLEFAMGDVSSTWGSVRAEMGHPESFSIKYMAIGNEDCSKPDYVGNYLAFFEALHTAYPDLNLIANCDMADSAPTMLMDYHIYDSPEGMISMHTTFDSVDRSSTPLIFNSEYATVGSEVGFGNLLGAVADAAWMTGLERNSDIVRLASYAPLLVHRNDTSWSPDAIVFTSDQVYGIPSYWVQVMFFNNPGVLSLKTVVSNDSLMACSITCAEEPCQHVVFKYVNLVNDTISVAFTLLNTALKLQSTGELYTLTSSSSGDENSFANPSLIVPVLSTVSGLGNQFTLDVPPFSVHVLTIATQ